jgi:hypothetical protein
MPETFPVRSSGVRQSFPALVLLLTAALGGCSGGDFGSTRQDMRSDDMHRWLGAEATGSVGLKASQFQLTDNERQLRDLAYPLIEPPLSRPAWKSVWGDYQPLPSISARPRSSKADDLASPAFPADRRTASGSREDRAAERRDPRDS